ncbi:NUDIX domain-containing protein [Candidatus Micrarchaeota archaeon]|nr:NUDIX domain-containing protein [Candidatus Micrarchaeota archaeon]
MELKKTKKGENKSKRGKGFRKYKVLGVKNKIIGEISNPTPENLNKFYNIIKAGYPGKLTTEFFEVLDSEGNKTGNIKLRGLVHKEGDWHAGIHFHVYSIDAGKVYFLMQRRKYNKDVHPGKLDVIVAGHYKVGESMEDGVREVEEEIGLVVPFNKFTILGRRKNYDRDPERKIINNQFEDVVVYRCDQPLEAYSLQEEELDGILKLPLKDFISLMLGKISALSDIEAFLFNPKRELEKTRIEVTPEDVRPSSDNYHLKTAILISRIIQEKSTPVNPYSMSIPELLD